MDEILRIYLGHFGRGNGLIADESEAFLDALIKCEDEDLIVRLLTAWNEKGICEDEIFALASILRQRMRRVASRHESFVDIVGTGGSSAKTFNVSTAAAFVTAGAGVPVAKHGNKSATSKAGSADVLSELGIEIEAEPKTSERNLNEHGICFMFAPVFHRLSPTLAAARRRVGKPTIFNILGPLCNPASAPHQVIGVWRQPLIETVAHVLLRLGTKKSWVVHGKNGLDEIAISDGGTHVAEVRNGEVLRFEVMGSEFGFDPKEGLPSKCTAAESAVLIRDVLENRLKDTNAERLVLINASAAIYVSGGAASLQDGYKKATESVRTGRAAEKLQRLSSSEA